MTGDTNSMAAARRSRCVVPDRGRTLAPMSRQRLSLFLPTLGLIAALLAGCVQVSSATAPPATTGTTQGTTTQNAALPGSSDAPVAGAASSPTTATASAGPV